MDNEYTVDHPLYQGYREAGLKRRTVQVWMLPHSKLPGKKRGTGNQCKNICMTKFGAREGHCKYEEGEARCNRCGVCIFWEDIRCPCCKCILSRQVHDHNQVKIDTRVYVN